MKRVHLSSKAQSDLEEIRSHVARDSPPAADRLLARIHRTCQSLAYNPASGRRRDELASDLRSFPVSHYVISYRGADEGIEVARVLSGYRDIARLFGL